MDLMLENAAGDPKAELTKGDFLLTVLKAYDLVDTSTLDTISREYDKLVEVPSAINDKKVLDTVAQAASAARRSRSCAATASSDRTWVRSARMWAASTPSRTCSRAARGTTSRTATA